MATKNEQVRRAARCVAGAVENGSGAAGMGNGPGLSLPFPRSFHFGAGVDDCAGLLWFGARLV